MTDDATSRAREVIYAVLTDRDKPPGAVYFDHAALFASRVARALAGAGLSIIDTSTHVAVPREPSEEMVERVARVIATMFIPAYRNDAIWREDMPMLRARTSWPDDASPIEGPFRVARAAIAAITGGGDAKLLRGSAGATGEDAAEEARIADEIMGRLG